MQQEIQHREREREKLVSTKRSLILTKQATKLSSSFQLSAYLLPYLSVRGQKEWVVETLCNYEKTATFKQN